MKLKVITGLVLTLFLIAMLTLALNIQPVKASGTIYIRADGKIEPLTANITSIDNVTYTFTDNIVNDSIVVERDDIVVDGADYTLQGTEALESRGIDLTGRSNITIKNIEVKAFWFGIFLGDSSNNTISGNNIANNWYGIQLDYSLNNTIIGNNITANNWYGIRLDYSSNNTISGNTFFNDGLIVLGSYGNVVVDNLVNDKPLVYLEDVSDYAVGDAGQVILVDCNNILVENLNLSHTDIGVQLWKTNNTTIIGNNITANNREGVRLFYSSNNSISGNNITANNWDGIHLYSSSGNTISGNNIANSGYGIFLDWSSNNNISGSNTANNGYGIVLWHSSSNSISGNNITANNRHGIWLDFSSSNKIFHNNFINNTAQVYSIGSVNNFDDGYPSGGNYWSDYIDVDQYSGPHQNETGSDEIWDHPYIIDKNNQDNYPIVPEFPTWAPILLMLIVLTFAIAIYKRRLLKTPIH